MYSEEVKKYTEIIRNLTKCLINGEIDDEEHYYVILNELKHFEEELKK